MDDTQNPAESAPCPEPPSAPGGSALAGGLADGLAVIQAHVKTLPNQPGVYRMLGGDGQALYVGKARNLRKRVTAYTLAGKHPSRLLRMIAETRSMEFVVTRSEVEALLLEANLIKRLRPRYNILLRDDKTFPHILITADHPFAQILKHRGAESRPGRYFGPFASAGAVTRTITALQRAFLLRNCSDAVFAARTRPCLQYQIKRCTAPCVGYVDEGEYAAQVAQAVDFLRGRSQAVHDTFAGEMTAASDRLDYEAAARWRDRIRALAAIHAHQDINVEGIDDADAFAAHQTGGQACIQVYFFRGGRNYGTRAYFPSHDKSDDTADVMAAFIAQFYDNRPPPPLVLLSHPLAEQTLVEEALSVRADRRVQLVEPKRGDKRRLIDHALANAREALARRLAESASQARLLEGVADAFALDGPPGRIEVYDNSHISGTNAYGCMIVAGPEGFRKAAYRKFLIKTAPAPGDDYAMMREVLGRRFARALKEDPDREAWPDLLLIDGGLGQLNAATDVLAELGIDDVPLVAIAKGPDRNAGRERFFMAGRDPFSLEPRDPVLYFLQRLRDEAHRFAIGTHRARRTKQIGQSTIDEIAGIGPRRKKALLLHFGSARAVARASLDDLMAVEGISETVARKIQDHFRGDG
ncbi:MAG: excinuclease ABC subunit UvrC [Rhodospirillaceae bacterium]|nr:excinuclease ABC subunit UvrC [Rhodospirillaceae bacterium]